MNEEELSLIKRGFDQGYSQGAHYMLEIVLKALNEGEVYSHILAPDNRHIKAVIMLNSKNHMRKKGLMPYPYDVMMGKAKDYDPFKDLETLMNRE